MKRLLRSFFVVGIALLSTMFLVHKNHAQPRRNDQSFSKSETDSSKPSLDAESKPATDKSESQEHESAEAPDETAADPSAIFQKRNESPQSTEGEVAESESKADAETQTALQENDDDRETSGSVDTTPRFSGVLQASARGTWYDQSELSDETLLEDEYTFQLEHTHIEFSGDLSEALRWEVTPCLTHMNDFSIITAFFTFEVVSEFRITAGRFLLPFGQFNLRSLPGIYNTVSRPLLYQSHEDSMIQFSDQTPSNFFFTPRDDTGLLLSGDISLGSEERVQVSYNGYVTNGLRAASNSLGRFWDDNNSAKQFGGRIGGRWNADDFTVGGGVSLLSNVYEDNSFNDEGLDQRAISVDAVLSVVYTTDRRINLRGEFVNMVREIQPQVALAKGDESIMGGYVTLDVDVLEILNVYYQFDTLTERAPRVIENSPITDLDDDILDLTLNAVRHAFGVSVTPLKPLVIRAEYGRWLEPEGTSDAHRGSLQTVLMF